MAQEKRNIPSGTHEFPQPPMPPEDPTLINLSEMVDKPGHLLKWLGRVFFGQVRVSAEVKKTIDEAGARGVPIFVMNSRSHLDYLYLNYYFLSVGLPLVFFANGINNLLFRPLGDIVKWIWNRVFGPMKRRITDKDLIAYAVARERPVALFLKRPKTLLQWGGEYDLTHIIHLVKVQRQVTKSLMLLPTVLVWHPTPGQYKKGALDFILGDPDAPGTIRKIISFVRNFSRALLNIGHSIDLKALMAGMEGASDEEVASKVKFLMHQEFRLTSKAIKGPLLKRRSVLVNEMMRNPDFVQGVNKAAEQTGKDPAAMLKKAKKLLTKMAADFSINYIEAFALFLAMIWNRLFTGIRLDDDDQQLIREAARTAPIVVMPTHRSHADYLLISSLFYFKGLIAPHIASGDNLNFWPVGHLFRRCGAFFIRRHFKGNPLYTHVAYSYLRKLLKEGYWVEFFLEGTRSRTGKMISPRTGMLGMICKAVATDATPDVWLLPSSVTYERVMEGRSYTKEAMGGEKKKEGFKDVVKTAKVLRTRYGRVYIQFGPPVSCRRYMENAGVKLPMAEDEEPDPKMVKRLAYFMNYRVMKTIVITPQNIVAFVLLTHNKQGISGEILQRRVGFVTNTLSRHERRFSDLILKPLAEYGMAPSPEDTQKSGRKLSMNNEDDADPIDTIGQLLHGVVEEALRTFKAEDAIEIQTFDDDQVISPVVEKRLLLDMYKNGIINEFVPEAILSAGYLYLFRMARVRVEDLREEARFLSRLFKLEFVYDPTQSFDLLFEQSMQDMIDEGIFEHSNDMLGLTDASDEVLLFYGGILGNFFESYLVMLETILETKEALPTKELLKKTMKKGWKYYATGMIGFPESVSMNYYKSALLWLTDEGFCERSSDKSKVVTPVNREEIQAIQSRLRGYMDKVVIPRRAKTFNR